MFVRIRKVLDRLIAANQAYRNGTPVMTDAAYDDLADELMSLVMQADAYDKVLEPLVREPTFGRALRSRRSPSPTGGRARPQPTTGPSGMRRRVPSCGDGSGGPRKFVHGGCCERSVER